MGLLALSYVLMMLVMILGFPFFIVYAIYYVHKENKINRYIENGMYDHANQLMFGKDCPKHFEMKDK